LHRIAVQKKFLRSITNTLMKISRAIAAIVFFAAVSASSVLAQVKPAGTPATTAPAQSATLPEAKIALG
jgi:hypothetical protein